MNSEEYDSDEEIVLKPNTIVYNTTVHPALDIETFLTIMFLIALLRILEYTYII